MAASKIRIGPILLFLLLTALTQIGGLAYLAARWVSAMARRRFGFGPARNLLALFASFTAIYLAVSVFVLPLLATALGRPSLPCTHRADQPVAPLTPVTCLLNRHYAAEPVHALLSALGTHMAKTHPGTVVAYLDAGFAFLDGFPMLPHLSHRDGHKVDLAFFYTNGDGVYRPLTAPSPIGYWAFEPPRRNDPQPCAGRRDLATLRWDMPFLQPFLNDLELDEARTGAMLSWIAAEAGRRGIERILLEPHLRQRFGLPDDVVRFQGCRPARHDDHVHIALRPAG